MPSQPIKLQGRINTLIFSFIGVYSITGNKYTKYAHTGTHCISKQILPPAAAPAKNIRLKNLYKCAVAKQHNCILHGYFYADVSGMPFSDASCTIQNREYKKEKTMYHFIKPGEQ